MLQKSQDTETLPKRGIPGPVWLCLKNNNMRLFVGSPPVRRNVWDWLKSRRTAATVAREAKTLGWEEIGL